MDSRKKIEDLLEERERIDQKLKEKVMERKLAAILSADVKGYSRLVGEDEEATIRTLIAYRQVVASLIQQHRGRVVDSPGDNLLAEFASAVDAVRCAVEIQRALKEKNAGLPDARRMEFRMGINVGDVVVEGERLYGEGVNIAARLEGLAEAGGLCISGTVHDHLKNKLSLEYDDLGEQVVKNIADPVRVYRVLGEFRAEAAPKAGQGKSPEKKSIFRRETGKGKEVFIIEASLEGKKLIISSYDKPYQEEKTLRVYQEKELSIEDLNLQCKEILNLLIQANRADRPGKGVKKRLEEEGERLYNMVFTPKIKEMLRSTIADHLILDIDDKLVQIPWELCFDGEDFLCRKYNMGRVVRTKQETSNVRYREIAGPLMMIILSNPTGDLKATQKEVAIIQKELAEGQIKVDLKHGNVDIAYVQKALSRYDLIHYAGHADYDPDNPSNSAWILKDGRLKASSILEMVGGMQTLPSFIFSNACQSGQTEPWNVEKSYTLIYGLANAFLLSGVRHYIGTFWEVQDEGSSEYAVEFYKELAQGSTIGEAVRKARVELTHKYPEDNLAWASYMLYGDPTYGYLKAQEKDLGPEPQEAMEESGAGRKAEPMESMESPIPGKRLRAEPEEAKWDPPLAGIRGRRFLYPTIALLLAFLIFAFSMLFPTVRAYLQTVIQKNKTEIAIKQEDLEKKKAEKDKQEWEEIHKLADELNKLK